MTQRSHTRVRGLLWSISTVGVLLIGGVAPAALSQNVTVTDAVDAPASQAVATSQPSAAPSAPAAAGNNSAKKTDTQDRDIIVPNLGTLDTQDEVADALKSAPFGKFVLVPKGTSAQGDFYTLAVKESAATLGQGKYIRLVRKDSGAPVGVREARINETRVDSSKSEDEQDRQILSLERPATVADPNIIEVDIEVVPGSDTTEQSWSLETSDEKLENSQMQPRSQDRGPVDFAGMGKIDEFEGGEAEINNFSIGKDPSFKLTEIVPEEDDGKVAVIRFTFQVDGLSTLHGPFANLKFNPRKWFTLQSGNDSASLEALPYLWHNDNEETNPEKSPSTQKWALNTVVQYSLDKKSEGGPFDEWYSPGVVPKGTRVQIKNGDTVTVRYKLTRDNYEVEPDSGLSGTPTANTYWVNTKTQFTRYDFSDDFKTIKVGRQFPTGRDYGDIAVTPDGKYLYAVEYRATGSHVMDKFDARTGALVGRGTFNLPYGDAAAGGTKQLNALTFDYDGKLIFSTPKENNIWKMDPSCVKDPALKSTCELGKGKDIEKLDLKWPTVPGGLLGGRQIQLTSAGDFFVGPDGSLFGAGTTDAFDSTGPSMLVQWPAKEPGNPAAGRSNEGIVIGKLPRPTYGMGRFGDFILSTQTDGTNDPNANSGLVWSHLVPDGKGGYTIEGEPLKATVESTVYGIFKPGESLWGATAVYDAGPYNEVILKIEKEVVGKRLDSNDQFELGAFLEKSPFTNSRSYSMPPVFATTPETGLQKEVSYNFVKPGLEYGIFEGFRTKTPEGERKNMSKENAEKYRASLKCVEGDNWDKGDKVVPTAALSGLTDKSDRESKLTIPTTPGLKAVTCRFINSTKEPLPSLALFKMADKDGRGNYEKLDGAQFALYEKDEKAPNGRGNKVQDITPNPEKGYSVDELEFDKRYILVETTAPAGYHLITEPIEFMFVRGADGKAQLKLLSQPTTGGVVLAPDDPHAQKVTDSDNENGAAITVVNVEEPVLPETGGPGLYRQGALGLMVLALGGLVMAYVSQGSRRRLLT